MSMHPTHAYFAPDGSIEFVNPFGYDEETLVELAPDHWNAPRRWNGTAFVEDIEAAKAAKWEAAKAKREAVHHGGCDTALGRVDTSEAAKLNVSGSVQLAMLAIQMEQPFNAGWTMADNTVVMHDAPAMLAMGQTVGIHVATTHAVARALRDAIEAAQSVADIDAIDVDAAPWPGL